MFWPIYDYANYPDTLNIANVNYIKPGIYGSIYLAYSIQVHLYAYIVAFIFFPSFFLLIPSPPIVFYIYIYIYITQFCPMTIMETNMTKSQSCMVSDPSTLFLYRQTCLETDENLRANPRANMIIWGKKKKKKKKDNT